MLFLTEIALWKYRAQIPGFELPTALPSPPALTRSLRRTAAVGSPEPWATQNRGFELPTALVTQQRQFDGGFALTLEEMAEPWATQNRGFVHGTSRGRFLLETA